MYIEQLQVSDFLKFGENLDLCISNINLATPEKPFATFKVILDTNFCPTFIATDFDCKAEEGGEGFDLTEEFQDFMKTIKPTYASSLEAQQINNI